MHRYIVYLGMCLLFLTQSGAALIHPVEYHHLTEDSARKKGHEKGYEFEHLDLTKASDQKEDSSTAVVCSKCKHLNLIGTSDQKEDSSPVVSYYDFKRQNLARAPEQKIEQIAAKIENPSQVVALGFPDNSMDAKCFQKLTDKLDPSRYNMLKILDVSNNPLNEEAVPAFRKWLEGPPIYYYFDWLSESCQPIQHAPKVVPIGPVPLFSVRTYINIVSTHLGGHKVERLFDALVKDLKEYPRYPKELVQNPKIKLSKNQIKKIKRKSLKNEGFKEFSTLNYSPQAALPAEDRALKMMEKFIFIPDGYLNEASKSVEVTRLAEDKKIPSNWMQIHRNFYSLPSLKELKKQRECNRFTAGMRSMEAAALYSSSSPKREQDDITAEEYEEEKFPFWANALLWTEGSLSQAALSEIYENKRK